MFAMTLTALDPDTENVNIEIERVQRLATYQVRIIVNNKVRSDNKSLNSAQHPKSLV